MERAVLRSLRAGVMALAGAPGCGEEGDESEAAWAEWEEEMRGYGYTPEEIAEMGAGGAAGAEGTGETAAWEHEVKRILIIKTRMHGTSDSGGGGDAGVGDEAAGVAAAGDEAAATAGGGDGEHSLSSERSRKRPRTDASATGADKAGSNGPVRLAFEEACSLTREQFWERYMLPNRPVLLRGAGRKWRATREWVTDEGLVNTRYLRQHFGHTSITVHNTARTAIGADTCVKKDVAMAEFLDWWEGPVGSRVRARGAVATATADADAPTGGAGGEGARAEDGQESANAAAALLRQEQEILYLKDWNFEKEFADYGLYEWPPWFREDWLNLYEERCLSDHRFVYLGVCVCVCVCVCVYVHLYVICT